MIPGAIPALTLWPEGDEEVECGNSGDEGAVYPKGLHSWRLGGGVEAQR